MKPRRLRLHFSRAALLSLSQRRLAPEAINIVTHLLGIIDVTISVTKTSLEFEWDLRKMAAQHLEAAMQNDNHLFADRRVSVAEKVRYYTREANLRRKRESPLASIPDLGIALTPEEDADLRAYAARLDIDFDSVAAAYAERFHITPPRKLGPIASSLAGKGIIPLNHLHLLLKNHIWNLHWAQKQ